MAEVQQTSQNGACPIPYPERFHNATQYVSGTSENQFNDEARLLFYALYKQATEGPCKESKPWAWNAVESAKWQSWSQLGNMSQAEAMRLYVRTLDEEQPEWWTRMPASPADEGIALEDGGVSISSVFQEGTWVVIQQDDAKKPLPRYEQGAALLGSQLYVMGGHYGGRYLQDVWVYNLNKLQWTAPQPPQQEAAEASGTEGSALLATAGPPAAAGWSVTPLQDKLLVMGGHVKVGKLKKGEALPRMSVWLLDVPTMTWSSINTSGQVPCARGGHSACLLPSGDKVVLYGGEDSHRRPLADAHILDLQELAWSTLTITSKVQPTARSGHVATVHSGDLLVFGGGSVANCFNDLWSLDLERGIWTKAEVQGPSPTPRAGHSAALVGNLWYALGGGNNVKGCTDMLVADLSELPAGPVSWQKVCSVPPGSPLSSEGISLLHATDLNLLVAFGGYNGKYHNAVSVYKLPSQQQQQQPVQQQQQQSHLKPATPAGQQKQQPSPAAQRSIEMQQQHQPYRTQSTPPASSKEGSQRGRSSDEAYVQNGNAALGHQENLLKELALSREQLKRDLAAARQELELVAGAADAAKEEAGVQVNMLQSQLYAVQANLAAAEKAVEDLRHALSAEQAKNLKLEAQLAEANDRLSSVSELERELDKYRRMAAEAAKKGSGGLWGYISGQNQAT